jgi:hypothetical protein
LREISGRHVRLPPAHRRSDAKLLRISALLRGALCA